MACKLDVAVQWVKPINEIRNPIVICKNEYQIINISLEYNDVMKKGMESLRIFSFSKRDMKRFATEGATAEHMAMPLIWRKKLFKNMK